MFNLFVPAYPLDGGRILANLLLMAGASLRTAAIVTVAVALPLGAGLLVLGIYFFQMVTILVGIVGSIHRVATTVSAAAAAVRWNR